MAYNSYLPYGTAAGANVLDDADYSASIIRTGGVVNGIADAPTANKVWRQSSVTASAFVQFIVNQLNININDDGNVANLTTNFLAALLSTITAELVNGFNSAYYDGTNYYFWRTEPDGFVKQGGFITGGGGTVTTFVSITFPIAFPSGQKPVPMVTAAGGTTPAGLAVTTINSNGMTIATPNGVSFTWSVEGR